MELLAKIGQKNRCFNHLPVRFASCVNNKKSDSIFRWKHIPWSHWTEPYLNSHLPNPRYKKTELQLHVNDKNNMLCVWQERSRFALITRNTTGIRYNIWWYFPGIPVAHLAEWVRRFPKPIFQVQQNLTDRTLPVYLIRGPICRNVLWQNHSAGHPQ